MAMPKALLLAFLLVSVFLFLLVQADEAVVGNLGQSYPPHKIDCGAACAARCRLASRQRMCHRACGTCCARCSCVPPGTSGNRDVCPCYAKMRTHGNRLKCP
ncbi:snakin-2-like [Malania oleifera]|uniref:snakin-2-like n=1 Tax=Malania oleifera TaxID=397392 RepID=UPI0025AE8364|nr:snakin-2-like [Malania oleifera]